LVLNSQPFKPWNRKKKILLEKFNKRLGKKNYLTWIYTFFFFLIPKFLCWQMAKFLPGKEHRVLHRGATPKSAKVSNGVFGVLPI
jgi:hypothetical protein